MNDLISRILSTIDVNKLATSFDVTIREFNDAHVIERLEHESWARGYNDDDSYDDDYYNGFDNNDGYDDDMDDSDMAAADSMGMWSTSPS